MRYLLHGHNDDTPWVLKSFCFLQEIFVSISDSSTSAKLDLQRADIAFLLDGSDDMQASERQSLDFVRDFVQQLNLGPNNVQAALVQYSTDPTVEFLLNTYPLKEDILRHLTNVKLKGGSTVNTGEALYYMKNIVFDASSGSRAQQGVPQILILLSGKKSGDDVFGPVEGLRKAGILLFSIGVNNADRLEMEQLAQGLGTSYFVQEKSDFPLVREQVLTSIALHKGTVSSSVGE